MAKKHSNPLDLFWTRVVKSPAIDGCWTMNGYLSAHGYGRAWNGRCYEQAHRFAYARLVAPIPDGAYVRHLCGTLHCVRPDHLVLATTLAVETVEARFWALVEKTETCWLWRGRTQKNGYGRFKNGREQVTAHRYAYADIRRGDRRWDVRLPPMRHRRRALSLTTCSSGLHRTTLLTAMRRDDSSEAIDITTRD